MSAAGGHRAGQVWRTCPIRDEPGDSDWASLTAPEADRAAAIAHPAARTRFVVGRALLRRTIAELRPELAERPIDLVVEPSGQPHVAGHPELGISLSHTIGLAAAAVCADGAVGIDVERRTRSDLPPPDMWMTPGEQQRLAAVEPADVRVWLLCLWVAKEATMKACDAWGLVSRRNLEIRPDPTGDDLAYAVAVDPAETGSTLETELRWLVESEGFIVAIATPKRSGGCCARLEEIVSTDLQWPRSRRRLLG